MVQPSQVFESAVSQKKLSMPFRQATKSAKWAGAGSGPAAARHRMAFRGRVFLFLEQGELKMLRSKFIPAAAILALLFIVSGTVFTQQAESQAGALAISPLPLPGDTAKDFEVSAVVGQEIKKVKLSEFRGKWVYLTFIPAAFTFV